MADLTLGFLITAVILNGFLAGENIDRIIVQMPAWSRVGPEGWAQYSRHADLGNGLFLYPFLAIGGCIATLIAALLSTIDRIAQSGTLVLIYITLILSIAGLLVTAKAAPIMLSLRGGEFGPTEVKREFEGFRRWGNIRAIFQIVAFITSIWAVIALLS